MEIPGQVVAIESETQFDKLVSDCIAISYFWADFHEPCKKNGPIDMMYTQLALLQPKLRFLKVSADDHTELAEKFEISIVPTFVFTKNSNVLDKLEGVSLAELAKRVDVLSKRSGDMAAEKEDSQVVLNKRLEKLTNSSTVMLFMKGNPKEPKCGFSKTMIGLLQKENVKFGSFDILTDDQVRQGLKTYSNWPTFPQLYVKGEFMGGLDIIQEMMEDGPLHEQLNITTEQHLEDETEDFNESLKALIHSAPVLLFMKGTPNHPECGFSRKVVQLLRDHQVPFSTFNILTDDQVRQGLKTFSNWPTYPQLYIKGNFIGGLDILAEMAEDGNLADQFEVKKKSSDSTSIDLKALTHRAPVMLFMKGNPSEPKCGFSQKIIEILHAAEFQFETFDILSNDDVRQGLKAFSNWPTFPQLYIQGELIGGLDIVKELDEEGELLALKP